MGSDFRKLKQQRGKDREGDFCKAVCQDAGSASCQSCCINVNHRTDWFCEDPNNPEQAACCTEWTEECYTIANEANNQHACNECYGYRGYGGYRGYYGGYRGYYGRG